MSSGNVKSICFDRPKFSVVLLLMPGFSILSFSAAVESMQAANDALGRQAYSWRTVAVEDHRVVSGSGVSIAADLLITDVAFEHGSRAEPHMVIVCGGRETDAIQKTTGGWLRNARKAGREIVGLDTATLLFAAAGLLEQKACTVHWEMIPALEERFGHRAEISTSLYEEDSRIFTCAGRAATLDLMASLIQREHGGKIASRVCEVSVMERQRGPGERQRLPLQSRHGVTSEKLVRAIERMADHLDHPVGLDVVADAAKLSRRQLERSFRRELGHTPSTFYRIMRLEKAHLLLIKSRTPIVEIAAGCGFASAAHFSKTYRTYYGVAPQESRRVAGRMRSTESVERTEVNPAFQRPLVRTEEKVAVTTLRGGLRLAHS